MKCFAASRSSFSTGSGSAHRVRRGEKRNRNRRSAAAVSLPRQLLSPSGRCQIGLFRARQQRIGSIVVADFDRGASLDQSRDGRIGFPISSTVSRSTSSRWRLAISASLIENLVIWDILLIEDAQEIGHRCLVDGELARKLNRHLHAGAFLGPPGAHEREDLVLAESFLDDDVAVLMMMSRARRSPRIGDTELDGRRLRLNCRSQAKEAARGRPAAHQPEPGDEH